MLAIFFILKRKKTCLQIIKINWNCERQIIILAIPNIEKENWYYLAVKNLSAFLRGINSKHDGDFYSLNYLQFFRTENKLKFQKKVCKNKDFCGTVRSSQKDDILQLNQYMKWDKMPLSILTLNLWLKKRWMYLNL